jgi:hypothetical protein
VKLQLIAGAQHALAWVFIWKLKLDIDEISQEFPPKKEGELNTLEVPQLVFDV